MPKTGANHSFLALLPMILEIVRNVCALKRVAHEEREDFESFIFAAFLGGDCRALRQYRGDCPVAGYLRVVIRRLLLDYRVQRWGKWRPSAVATRLGPVAIELERLIERDGCSRWEAVRHLRLNREVERSDLELLELAEQLPHRALRRFEGEEALEEMPASSAGAEQPDRCVTAQEAGRVRTALGHALEELGPGERRLLAQRFADGLTVAEIARRSGENQRRLYRRLKRILGGLRSRLETLGVERGAVQSVLGYL